MSDEAPPPAADRHARQFRGQRTERLRPGRLRLLRLWNGLIRGPGPAVLLRPDHPPGPGGRSPGGPLRPQAHDDHRRRRIRARAHRRHPGAEHALAPTRSHPGGHDGLLLPGGPDRARAARLRHRPGRREGLPAQRRHAAGRLLRPLPAVPAAGRPPAAPGGAAGPSGPGRLHLPGDRDLLGHRHARRRASKHRRAGRGLPGRPSPGRLARHHGTAQRERPRGPHDLRDPDHRHAAGAAQAHPAPPRGRDHHGPAGDRGGHRHPRRRRPGDRPGAPAPHRPADPGDGGRGRGHGAPVPARMALVGGDHRIRRFRQPGPVQCRSRDAGAHERGQGPSGPGLGDDQPRLPDGIRRGLRERRPPGRPRPPAPSHVRRRTGPQPGRGHGHRGGARRGSAGGPGGPGHHRPGGPHPLAAPVPDPALPRRWTGALPQTEARTGTADPRTAAQAERTERATRTSAKAAPC